MQELAAGRATDVFRRELQNDFLAGIDGKLNPPPTTATLSPFGGPPPAPLSEDEKSHLRGQLVTLREEIRRAIPRTGNRATQLHLQGALYRIGEILEPRRSP